MNETPEAIVRWLEQKRRTQRAWAAVICLFALGCGAGVFLVTSVMIYGVMRAISFTYVHSELASVSVALGLTSWAYARVMKRRREEFNLELDPMGLWIIRDLYSVGPRLLLEGLRQLRCCAELGELNVAASARILTYLARKNAAVTRDELMAHCAQVPWERLKAQLL
jgi:nitric oxide reductase large subunit